MQPPGSLQHYLQLPRHGNNLVSIIGQMDKEGINIYTMEYYAAIKKKEILPFAQHE